MFIVGLSSKFNSTPNCKLSEASHTQLDSEHELCKAFILNTLPSPLKIHLSTGQVCVCSLSQPKIKAHASHCHLWPVWLYHIFPHYLITVTIFREKVIQHKMCVFYPHRLKHFSLQEEFSGILSQMYTGFHVSCQILIKVEFSGQVFEKIHIKIS